MYFATLFEREDKRLTLKTVQYIQYTSCLRKKKLSMEEASECFSRYNFKKMSIYLCAFCGWLHFGHHSRRGCRRQLRAKAMVAGA